LRWEYDFMFIDRGVEEAFMAEITIRIPDSVLKTVLLVVAGVTVSWQ